MTKNTPIHWTGPHKDPSTDWLSWRTTVAGHTLTVATDDQSSGFLWAVTHGGRRIPSVPKDRLDRCCHTLPLAQKAARDAIIDYADGLADAARRVVSTIKPPEPT